MTGSKHTKQVAVDPIQKSKRGWLSVASALGGLAVAGSSDAQLAVVENPGTAGLITAVMALIQWLLTWWSKKNVVSKTVLIKE